MITLEHNVTNDVVVTLSEKTIGKNPVYIFEFIHTMSGEKKYFTAPDISTAVGRYNEFEIVISNTENLYNGVIDVQDGQHLYTVREQNYDDVTVVETDTLSVGAGEHLIIYGSLTNYGTINIAATGILQVVGTYSNFGTTNNSGTLLLLPVLGPSGHIVETGKVTVNSSQPVVPNYLEYEYSKNVKVYDK